ncbi:TonB-dependent receptor domain-containing protein [Xenophilus sp. Marseille-Q4582]|uniref:TonB-dependent receptor domain-containing protein n=1 Tax=Xenophilus sp. Marseille-Q4582 TaxID=2866600 RepID=UPI00351D317F
MNSRVVFSSRAWPRLPLHALAGAVGAALPMLAAAQSPQVAPLAVVAVPALHETVVTATRVAQPLSDLVADVSIVDRDTIEASGATGVLDVLARLPGIEISRNGSIGSTSSVFVRGAETRFTAVYLDGVRLDTQSTGGAPWEAIPLAQVERIEVLRGPAAAVYGSDAIGGVIQIFTRKGEGGVQPFVSAGIGSQRTRKVETGVSGQAGDFDYAVGASYQESAGFDVRTPDIRHNPDLDLYRTHAANVRLGWRINAQHRLDANALASEMQSAYDASSGSSYTRARIFNDDRNHHHLRTAGLGWTAQWTPEYKTRLSVTDSSQRYETRIVGQPASYITQTQLRDYRFENEYRTGAHLVTAALERREDRLLNPALDAYSKTIDRERSQDAVALGYGYVQGRHSLQLNVRHDKDSEFGGKTTGSAAYGYEFAKGWRVTASAGTAFRAPTLYQRFSEYGDPSLQPEASRNMEVGLRYASGDTNASVVAYRNRVRNLIVFDGARTRCGAAFGCYNSVGRAEYTGITFAAGHRIGDLTLRASLDLQEPRDLDTDKLLARRARAHGVLGADWRIAGWTLGAEVQASGRRWDNAANTTRLGGYTLVNLSASTQITPEWTVSARVDNATDKRYELARGYATAGRTAYVNLKWAPR